MSEEIEPHIVQQYKIIQKIGSGAYGIVWKVKDLVTGKIYALKKNFDAFANSTDAQRTYREIMFLRQLNSPYIIKLHTVHRAFNDKDIYLVFEFVDVDLYTLSRDQTILTGQHKKFILYQIAKALFYLHCSKIIHRDLKPSNVLVNQDCQIKLCDFGLVRSLQENTSIENITMTDYIATRWYRAPEILFSIPHYSEAVDVWSFGCLMGQLMKGKALFPGTSSQNQLEKILAWTGMPTNKQLKQVESYISKETITMFKPKSIINKRQFVPCEDKRFHRLMDKSLKFSPNDRPTIQQILTDQYFEEFYSNEIQEIQQIKRARKRITVPVDDNKRLTVNQYRQLIYCEIAANYRKNKDRPTEDLKITKQIRKKKSSKKYSNPNIQLGAKNSPTTIASVNPSKEFEHPYVKESNNVPKEMSHCLSTEDGKVRKTKIYSADPSFKVSRSNSTKKQTSMACSNSKKKKGISIYSTKLKTEGYVETDTIYPSYTKDPRLMTTYGNKYVKIKLSKENNGSSVKSKEKVDHPIKKCLQETTTKKIKRAVNLNYGQKCYTEAYDKYQR